MAKDLISSLFNAPIPEDFRFFKVPAKDKLENVEAMERGDLPPGFDVNALIADIEAEQQQSSVRAATIQDAISTAVGELQGYQSKMGDIINSVDVAQTGVEGAAEGVLEADNDLGLSDMIFDIGKEEELQKLAEQNLQTNSSLSTDLQDSMQRLLDNYAVVEKSNDMGIMDIIKNPIEAIKTKIEAKKAKQDATVLADRITAIDGIHRANAAIFQRSADTIQLQTAIRRMDDLGRHQRVFERTQLLKAAELRKTHAVEDLRNLQEAYGLSDSAMKSFTSALNAMTANGQLTETKLDQLIKAKQLETATWTLERTQEIAARDDASRQFVNTQLNRIASSLFPEVVPEDGEFTVEVFDQYIKSGLITAEQAAITGSLLMNNAGVSAVTILDSDDPLGRYEAVASMNSSVIPEGVKNIINRVDTWKDVNGAALKDNPDWAMMDDKQRKALRNDRIKQIYQGMQVNADTLFKNFPDMLHSPNALDFNLPDMRMPAAVADEVKKWRLPTTSFEAYVTDAINRAGRSSQDPQLLAQAMASVARHHLSGVNNATGFGLKGLKSPALNGLDATNPAAWYEAIKLQQARAKSAIPWAGIGKLNPDYKE